MKKIALLTTLVASMLGGVHSAHSRRRPGRRLDSGSRYDRSITTFDSDGRLKQVEYGMEASRRGDSVAAMVVPSKQMALLVVKSSDKVHRIDAHILLVTAGLAGDGRALASSLRASCQRFRLSFGEAPTVQEVARMTSDIQHELTTTAGARPLGCTAIVVGFDLSLQQGESPSPEIFQAEPGGILDQCSFCSAGKNRDSVLTILAEVFHKMGGIDGDANIIHLVVTGLLNALSQEKQEDEKNGITFDLWCLTCDSYHTTGGTISCIKGVDMKSATSSAEKIIQAVR